MRKKMNKHLYRYIGLLVLTGWLASCSVPTSLIPRNERKTVPQQYAVAPADTANSATIKWRNFFADQQLVALIDTALANNQELNIVIREISIAKNEVKARKGEYLPFINLQGSAGLEKVGRFTRQGSVEANSDIAPGTQFPDPLPDFLLAANFSWQVDIWKKLRNATKSAMLRYLATTEGKNFLVTHLIAEVATSYYELMALDNQLEILKRNIEIQQNALEIVKQQKQAAKVTELAVKRFEAEVLKNQSRIYRIQQDIVETENRINFLVGRFPQHVERNSDMFIDMAPTMMNAGLPSQLLKNRPDIRQAELELAATKIDVTVARANFYPSLDISAGAGLNAYNGSYLFTKPESMIYALAGGLTAPLVNRNAIKAMYYNANARQIQAVYNYERTILNACIEVANQVSNINNMRTSYDLRAQQVRALTESIDISTRLFKSARADYMEVLLTQRDALESRFELIDTKMQQLHAVVNMYQALGGGWN